MRDRLSTAVISAAFRAAHRFVDGPPLVFDDPWALPLSGLDQETVRVILDRQPYPPSARLFTLTRARIVDEAVDRAYAQGVRQYVVLGAGYDSFALRRSDDLPGLDIYEVDHPITQAQKRSRLADLSAAPDVRWVAVDLAVDDLSAALTAAGFDVTRPTVWSWIGVALYLSGEDVEATLRALAGISPAGSTLVASFTLDRSEMDDIGALFDATVAPLAAERGEPHLTRYRRGDFAALAASCGWPDGRVIETAETSRWFDDRTDGLRPGRYEEVLVAQR